jgi:hypothetical protein
MHIQQKNDGINIHPYITIYMLYYLQNNNITPYLCDQAPPLKVKPSLGHPGSPPQSIGTTV